MAATALQTLVERVANRYGFMTQFTATGGTTNTAVSAELWQDDNFWEGAWLFVRTDAGGASAAPEGEERQIKQFTDSSDTATTGRVFTAAIANGDTCQIYTRWSRAMIVNALNSAVRNALHFHRKTVDESLLTASGTHSFSLAAITPAVTEKWGLARVSIEWDTATGTFPFLVWNDWLLRWDVGVPTLQFTTEPPAGRNIRLEYLALPTAMSAMTDTTGIESASFDQFLEEWALFELWQAALGTAQEESRPQIRDLIKQHRDEAERIRADARMHEPARRFRAPYKRQGRSGPEWIGYNATPSS